MSGQSRCFEKLEVGMETREKILEAALELFVENGLYGVATSKISKKAGVSTGILFHHFETKDKLIAELYACNKAKYMQEAIEQVEISGTSEMKLRQIWDSMLLRCSSNPLLSKFCRQIEHSPFIENVKQEEKMQNILNKLSGIFEKGIDDNEIKNMPIELLTSIFNSMQAGVVIYLQANPDKMAEPDFMDSVWKSAWCALKK